MRVFALSFVFLTFIGMGCFAAPANAAENLSFDSRLSESSYSALELYFTEQLHKDPADISIAGTDLNEDGLNEFILRYRSCETACKFQIVAENKGTIVPLGEIPGRTLLLGNDYTQGVRSLLAFEGDPQKSANDYQYSVYVWDPMQSRYMMRR